MVIQATCSQGNCKFRGSGRQCLANATSAIDRMKKSLPSAWDKSTLDSILADGDDLYMQITQTTSLKYLSLDDIPSDLANFPNIYHGTLQCKTEVPFYNLEEAVKKALGNDKNSGCIFTMGITPPAYSAAILKEDSYYYFFDPHCRNECGMASAQGVATMTCCKNISEISLFIKHLAASLNLSLSTPYEIARPNFVLSQNVKHVTYCSDSDSKSEFSGFEEMSEGEYTCRLYLAQNLIDSDVSVSDVSDVSSTVLSDLSIASNTFQENANCSSLIDDAIDKLDTSDLYFESLDLQTFEDIVSTSETDSASECCEIQSPEEADSDSSVENCLPLSFLKMKKERRDQVKNRTLGKGSELLNEQNTNEMMQKDPSANETAQGKYQNIRGRKRIKNEHLWKHNIAKRRRNEGKSYLSYRGVIKPERVVKPACGSNCKFRCNQNFTEHERETIFHTFWETGSITLQRQFITKFCKKSEKKRNKSSQTNRLFSFCWQLPKGTDMRRVCNFFFLNTLCISDQFVYTAHNKVNQGMVVPDMRGKNKLSHTNKVSQARIDLVKEHINSFPKMESHYCRKDSHREYLSPSLNVCKMYEVYLTFCKKKQHDPVTLSYYRHIFNTQFNMDFHKPKKDQCDLCTSYTNAVATDKQLLKSEYLIHLRNKDMARENKFKDKNKTETDSDLIVACFDLEQVLSTPKAFNSSMYYKRQLNNYNFTVFDLGQKQGYSFLWNETIAGRGACEIASCVFHFIKYMSSKGKKKFIFYSDNCIPQNKNRFYVSMLWHCIHTMDIESISHKYLEKGHTQNENDSMHSAIERSSRKIEIYSTAEWAAVIRCACRKKPFKVQMMDQTNFYDFKQLSENLKNFEYTTEKERVTWKNIRVISLSDEHKFSFFLKYHYDSDFHSVSLLGLYSTRSDARAEIDMSKIKLNQLRENLIPVSAEKYDDLVSLCVNDIIPKNYHLFYLLLPHL